jgi:hypothetical protein
LVWLEAQKNLQHAMDAEGLAHRRVTDGRAKRVRASDVDQAWRSYSPSFEKRKYP